MQSDVEPASTADGGLSRVVTRLVETRKGVRLVLPALLLDLSDSLSVDYAVTAFVLAVAATGLAHLLLLTTPRPRTFFGWIIGLATVCGVAAPFATSSPMSSQVATAVINLALGVCTGSLVSAVMSRTAFAATRPLP